MKRRLNHDEAELWGLVAKTARPLRPSKPAPLVQTLKKGKATASKPAFSIDHFEIGSRPGSRPLPQPTVRPKPTMDAKKFGKLKKGRLVPEATLDLHGMTQAEAYPELIGFVSRAATRGMRLVLVITGKGKSKNNEAFYEVSGVLRQNVPGWLASPAIKPLILEVVQAHQKHGGGGAYYVYLRRNGK